MNRREHEMQCAIIDFATMYETRYPALHWLYHIPNEGRRSEKGGYELKRAGMKAGVVDLHLPIPVGGFHGLFAECKIKPRKLTEKQAAFLSAMRLVGHYTAVWWTFDQAAEDLLKYVRGEL